MSVSLDVKKIQDSTPTEHYDVVVVGAGPYGLSAAAHLMAHRLKVAAFGKPIFFWRNHMPEGMLLRSYWWATDLSDPYQKYSFRRYFQEKGIVGEDPIPLETFIDYGLWFQQNAVPTLDETYVSCIERKQGHFVVSLEDGRVIRSNAVVMAPGLQYYRYCPPEFSHMPAELVSHSSDHPRLSVFAGKQVAVIGRGQAAIETSALLNESGAQATLLARHPIHWIRHTHDHLPPLLRELRAPKAGMGNGWLNVFLEKYPYAFQRLPRDTRDYLLATRHGPAGSPWLYDRVVGKIDVREDCRVTKIEEAHGKARLTLSDDKTLEVDHVILGTGYQTDIARLPMLHPSLLASLKTYAKAPELTNWFESSVPGLYFIGFTAARFFGPFYRFVIGDQAAARRVTQAIVRQTARSRL